MKLLVALLIVLGVGGFVVSWIATAYTRERRSIERYSQTMGVMQKLGGESHQGALPTPLAEAKPHIKVVGKGVQTPAPGSRSLPRMVDPAVITKALGAQAAHRSNGGETPVLHPSDAGTEVPPVAPIVFDEVGGRVDSNEEFVRPKRTTSRFSGREGRVVASPRVIAAVAAVVVIVAGASYFLLSRPTKSTAPLASKSTATTVNHVAKETTTTTTTVPPALTLVSSSAQSSTYTAPAGNYTVVVSVSAPCWLAQSVVPGGAISWDAILQPGQSRAISTSGPLTIRSGNSRSMTILVNGSPLHFTSPPGAYDISFVSVG